MRISGFIWFQTIVDKLERKHQVEMEEVEEVFAAGPQFRLLENGEIAGEHLYAAYGRTSGGRYLTVIFIRKVDRRALIVTARDMDQKERRQYGRKR